MKPKVILRGVHGPLSIPQIAPALTSEWMSIAVVKQDMNVAGIPFDIFLCRCLDSIIEYCSLSKNCKSYAPHSFRSLLIKSTGQHFSAHRRTPHGKISKCLLLNSANSNEHR